MNWDLNIFYGVVTVCPLGTRTSPSQSYLPPDKGRATTWPFQNVFRSHTQCCSYLGRHLTKMTAALPETRIYTFCSLQSYETLAIETRRQLPFWAAAIYRRGQLWVLNSLFSKCRSLLQSTRGYILSLMCGIVNFSLNDIPCPWSVFFASCYNICSRTAIWMIIN